MQAVTGIILLGWAWEDIRHQSLPFWRLLAGSVVLLLFGGMYHMFSFGGAVAGAIPGMYLLGMAAFGEKKKSIGEADGMVLLVLGMLYGLWASLMILLYSLLLFCLLAGTLALARKIGSQDRLPFIPCMLGGYLCYVLPEFLGQCLEVTG